MTNGQIDEVLVVLNVTPALEQRVVDWLLARSGSGFTSFPVAGLSARHDNLSAAEKVAGQQRRQQISVQMPAASVDRFLEQLGESLGNVDVRFWVLPVMQSGALGNVD